MHTLIIQPDAIFQALSDPIRIRIVRLMTVADEEACLCELVDSLEERNYKLSRHVKILKQVGLLSAQKEGRWIYHRLINEEKKLDHLYAFIKTLPDKDETFKKDLLRFNKRIGLREAGRCRVGIQLQHLIDGTEVEK